MFRVGSAYTLAYIIIYLCLYTYRYLYCSYTDYKYMCRYCREEKEMAFSIGQENVKQCTMGLSLAICSRLSASRTVADDFWTCANRDRWHDTTLFVRDSVLKKKNVKKKNKKIRKYFRVVSFACHTVVENRSVVFEPKNVRACISSIRERVFSVCV